MTEDTHTHHEEGPRGEAGTHEKRPYWQRAHRDWKFWVGVFFIALAIFIYVTSVDLSLVPSRHPHSVPASQ
jgi:hypothetical protein